MNKRIIIPIKVIMTLGLGVVCAIFLNFFFSKNGIHCFSDVLFGEESTWTDFFKSYKESLSFSGFDSIIWERIIILSITFSFVFLHFLFGIKRAFEFIFKYRWIVGIVVLFTLVALRYNGESMDLYESIQYKMGSEYEEPIIGQETEGRSDETLVSTARRLYYYSNGEPGMEMTFANIIQNPNILMTKALLKIGGIEYALSFDYYFYIILAFLISIELFLIITENRRLLSLACTCMIFFSTFYLWWIFPTQLLNTMGVGVFLYHSINTKSKKKRCLFGILTALFSIRFVFSLYPAWQVPAAYILLAIIVWIIIDGIKSLKEFDKKDWLILIGAVIFMLIGMGICYLDKLEYISSVTKTVYPGERREYGNYTLNKLYNYIPNALFWLKHNNTPSEFSIIINLFPIPLFMSIYYIIKEKKKDALIVGLSIVSLLLIIYCSNGGLPKTIANLFLLSSSTAWRAVDMVAYAEVLLFARVYSKYRINNNIKKKTEKKYILVFSMISLVFALYSIHMSKYSVEGYMPQLFVLFMIVLLFVICYLVISNNNYRKYKSLTIILILFSLFTGMLIRPIRKNADAVYNKPLSKEISKIKEEDADATWITYNSIISQAFLKCYGIEVLNYVNITPNMDLWKKIDPDGKYNEVYNRYAHVLIVFTDEESSFELVQADWFILNISYKDLYKMDVDYVFSHAELSVDNKYVELEEEYGEGNAFIYKVIYK